MSSADHQDRRSNHGTSSRSPDLIPREFLRAIAVWSLIPAYLAAGGFIGWLVDTWLHSSPFGVGVGLLIALAVAVKDMLRLRDEM